MVFPPRINLFISSSGDRLILRADLGIDEGIVSAGPGSFNSTQIWPSNSRGSTQGTQSRPSNRHRDWPESLHGFPQFDPVCRNCHATTARTGKSSTTQRTSGIGWQVAVTAPKQQQSAIFRVRLLALRRYEITMLFLAQGCSLRLSGKITLCLFAENGLVSPPPVCLF